MLFPVLEIFVGLLEEELSAVFARFCSQDNVRDHKLRQTVAEFGNYFLDHGGNLCHLFEYFRKG
jgi:hypothetical protein